jgi:hypothetical protein
VALQQTYLHPACINDDKSSSGQDINASGSICGGSDPDSNITLLKRRQKLTDSFSMKVSELGKVSDLSQLH